MLGLHWSGRQDGCELTKKLFVGLHLQDTCYNVRTSSTCHFTPGSGSLESFARDTSPKVQQKCVGIYPSMHLLTVIRFKMQHLRLRGEEFNIHNCRTAPALEPVLTCAWAYMQERCQKDLGITYNNLNIKIWISLLNSRGSEYIESNAQSFKRTMISQPLQNPSCPLLSLPAELHLEILSNLPSLPDQISASLAYPLENPHLQNRIPKTAQIHLPPPLETPRPPQPPQSHPLPHFPRGNRQIRPHNLLQHLHLRPTTQRLV